MQGVLSLSSPCCPPGRNLVLGGTLPVSGRIPILYQDLHLLWQKNIYINMTYKQISFHSQIRETWIDGFTTEKICKLTLKYLSVSCWSLSNVWTSSPNADSEVSTSSSSSCHEAQKKYIDVNESSAVVKISFYIWFGVSIDFAIQVISYCFFKKSDQTIWQS